MAVEKNDETFTLLSFGAVPPCVECRKDSGTKRPLTQKQIWGCSLLPRSWLERRGGTVHDFSSPSRVNHAGPLSRTQYARLVDERVDAVGL